MTSHDTAAAGSRLGILDWMDASIRGRYVRYAGVGREHTAGGQPAPSGVVTKSTGPTRDFQRNRQVVETPRPRTPFGPGRSRRHGSLLRGRGRTPAGEVARSKSNPASHPDPSNSVHGFDFDRSGSGRPRATAQKPTLPNLLELTVPLRSPDRFLYVTSRHASADANHTPRTVYVKYVRGLVTAQVSDWPG